MQGGVRKRGKTWSYYFYIGIVDGKKKYKEKGGFRLKSEAQEALREAMTEFENGGFIKPKGITFMQFSMEWLENYVKPLRKVSTYNRYRELINKYLNDIGNMNIGDIQSYHLEELLLKNKNNISGSTLQGIYTIINTIMNRALHLKLIKDNPCKYVERPKRDKFTPDTLEIEEIEQLFDVLDQNNNYDYMFFIALKVALELGLRRGELGGLEWSDIDFKENLITVNNNLIYSNGHVLMSTPKTEESNRTIYVSDQILNILRELKEKQEENKNKYGKFYVLNTFDDKDYDLVMAWQNGKYIHPMYYLDKLKKVLKKAGINKDIRFHDLRHTNATLLISQGIDFKTVQNRLGHKDINTTLNIYSHVNKEMQKKATDKLSKILNK
ncbi:tyrosine-type recombinase/integrase [Clostridium peptidivorans]|uniref:tyrosine-type recombinase/integrase n=1 Tax=Clostridium peptidivorans TaxID=100174 RepID=UPI000BE347C1|nr:site-specific integrase [Clostridium peptidivorans]